MIGQSPVGKVQTVLGPIDPDELGVTLTHEHLLIDIAGIASAPAEAGAPAEASAKGIYHMPYSLEIAVYVGPYSVSNRDNSMLRDVSTAIEEAMLYRQHGGHSLVDATSIGIGRDPVGLARISRATGLNIVMGASYYVHSSHPPDMDSRSEDDLVEQIVRDVMEGVDGTGIKSGIIGEVGCYWPLRDNERKVLRASGRAQRITGAPVLIHPGIDERAPFEVLDILSDAGADVGKVIIGHIERTLFEPRDFKRLAESGCYIEWDFFGFEQSYRRAHPDKAMPNDATRMDHIAWLSSEGYGDKIVVAHDICSKAKLFKYGGHGYFYLLAHIVPRMRARGFSEDLVRNLLVENPKRALTFSEPRS